MSRLVVLFDVALVVFVTVLTETHVFGAVGDPETHIYGPRWLTVALPLLIALPLLWRRRRPLLMTALVVAGFVIQGVASGRTPEGVQIILIWVVMPYSVAAFSERRGALVGLALMLAGYAVYAAENAGIRSGGSSELWAGGSSC